MKLDIECVRDVLLELEALPVDCHTVNDFPDSIAKHGVDNVEYTLAKLKEADYINADIRLFPNGQYDFYGIYCMTFRGHEYLASVKQPDVWEKLKHATTTGGSAGIKLLGDIAVDLGKAMLSKKLGLN